MQQRGRRTSEQPFVRISDDDEYLDEEYNDVWTPGMHRYQDLADVRNESSQRRPDVQPLLKRSSLIPGYQGHGATQQTGRQRAVRTDDVPHLTKKKAQGIRAHWLLYAGLAMLVMILGWVALSAFLNWWQITQDDWHYGRPRTYQVDAVVGHNDSASSPSHFIAINLNRHIEIVEFPGGDTSKAKIYMGPALIGAGQDLTVVTLSFKDVNGDGKPDMIVNVQGSHFVFINANGGFRAAPPNQNLQI
jgi:hypothetical protein